MAMRWWFAVSKSARLHRYRPIRETNCRDIGIGPDPGLAPDPPRQPIVRQLELMRRADQRGLVGVMDTSCSLVRQSSRHRESTVLARSTQARGNPYAALSAAYMPIKKQALRARPMRCARRGARPI